MTEEIAKTSVAFQTIETTMVDRLVREADARTIQPQIVNWKAIHLQAAKLRSAG